MQAVSLLLLDPLLKQLFGNGLTAGGGSALEQWIPKVIGPVVAGAVILPVLQFPWR